MSISERYIHHRNLIYKGETEIGFLKRLASYQGLMVAWLFARDLFPDLPRWVFIVVAPCLVCLQFTVYWLVGKVWDRRHLFDQEASWQNKRNPVITRIENELLIKRDSPGD